MHITNLPCSCFWRITTQAHLKIVVVVAVIHRISWAAARAGPVKHVAGLMCEVHIVVIVAVVHHTSRAAVWAGPSKHKSRLMGRAEGPL